MTQMSPHLVELLYYAPQMPFHSCNARRKTAAGIVVPPPILGHVFIECNFLRLFHLPYLVLVHQNVLRVTLITKSSSKQRTVIFLYSERIMSAFGFHGHVT